jgi:hypothetical protein
VEFRDAAVNNRNNQQGATSAPVCLLARGGRGLGRRDIRPASRLFLLEPQVVVFSGPVKIDGAAAHRLKGALHADGADVNVSSIAAMNSIATTPWTISAFCIASIVVPYNGKIST